MSGRRGVAVPHEMQSELFVLDGQIAVVTGGTGARRDVPPLPDGKVGLADVGNDYARNIRSASCLNVGGYESERLLTLSGIL